MTVNVPTRAANSDHGHDFVSVTIERLKPHPESVGSHPAEMMTMTRISYPNKVAGKREVA
jgi:hypothetical protein